jgi:hypothetical protein
MVFGTTLLALGSIHFSISGENGGALMFAIAAAFCAGVAAWREME